MSSFLGPAQLESISKKICNSYVSMNGDVLVKFDVPAKGGGTRKYDPEGKRNQKRCSSLRDLLFLIYNTVASDELRLALDEFRAHMSTLDSSVDPFDMIYEWRNQSLHGTTSFQTIGGALLNFALLVIVHQIANQYDSIRNTVTENCRHEVQLNYRSSWSFYPPY